MAQSWQSSKVQIDGSGKLTYTIDTEGNRIPDFSYAGYRNSEVDLPLIETVLTISPVDTDNTVHIQNAIDSIGNRNPDVNGFRGALYLQPGVYNVSGTLYLNKSGVVLRGAGDDSDPSSNTIIRAVGNTPDKRTVLIAGGGSSTRWHDAVPNTTTNIVSDLVPVGSRSFEVEDSSTFQVGDNIIIYHPCTEQWLQAVDYGSTHGDPGWTVGSEPLIFNRYIENIQGNEITIDAPVFNHLNRSLSQAYIYKYSRNGLLTKIGIENLRIDIVSGGSTDENHAWNAIDLYQIEDAWVLNCTMLHFGLSGIRTDTATRITIDNCQALNPNSVIEGSKRYNFHLHIASQLVLFKNCHATNGRHHYVSNGASSVSGCVFYNCTSSGAYTSSEGHRRWSMGLLYDNHLELDGPRIPIFDPRLLGLYNCGNWGTGHGWASAHSVCWNCNVAGGDIAIQKPPTAQNYAIGCFANRVTGSYFFTCPFSEPTGYIEGPNTPGLEPQSLFLAQLYDRLNEASGQKDPIVDTFTDGGFSADPVWTGDTDDWQVVIHSDVSTGATYSYTLRLNVSEAASGTKYLTTQRTASWGSSQSWGIWVGRRLSAASDENQSIVWLWANEPDLTSSSVDGYRLKFGDNFANDQIVLQRVTDGQPTYIISSVNAVSDGITDAGFLVRVIRTEFSKWTLYTSVLPSQNGQGAIATDIPSADNTPVYQGSVTDATYTTFENGYFGLMAVYDNDIDSRTGAEFDQFYFDTSFDASLPVELISFTAEAGKNTIELKWITASEIENLGFIILRSNERNGDYVEIDSYERNPQLQGAGNSSDEHFYHYSDYSVSKNYTHWYKLGTVDFRGMVSEYGPVSAETDILPAAFYLNQNYPNPFNPMTKINYQLPNTNYVNLNIYNILGQKVATLVSEKQEAGYYQVIWNAGQFSSGIYYYRIEIKDPSLGIVKFRDEKKMILIK